MKGYGQFCPVAKAAEILAERWTFLVLRELILGSTRFNDLRRGVPLMSSSLLAQRLRYLEREGLIERRPARSGRGFEYDLSDAGSELEPVILQLGEWGARWVRSQLTEHDLDVTLLMWDMHRTVRPEHFPAERVVVAFDFTGVPQSKRRWWLVSEGDQADLCMTDPGFETDLFITTDLRTMTAIWRATSRSRRRPAPERSRSTDRPSCAVGWARGSGSASSPRSRACARPRAPPDLAGRDNRHQVCRKTSRS